jgi:FMN phosphatase YigB (HAD superfamily)
MFNAALQSVGVSRERAVMVGDSPETDVEGARRAGITGVLVSDDEQLSTDSLAANAVVPDLSSLFDPEILLSNHEHRRDEADS